MARLTEVTTMINSNLLAILHDKTARPEAPTSVAGGARSQGRQSGGGGGGGDDSNGDDSWSGHSH